MYTYTWTLFFFNRLTTHTMYTLFIGDIIDLHIFKDINMNFTKYYSINCSLCLGQLTDITSAEFNYISFCCVINQCKVNAILVDISVNMRLVSINSYDD